MAKVVAKWNATLSAGEVHKGTHRIMIHWPHACPSIIVIEKGIVVEQTMHCPAILGFFESEAHGALYCSNDIMAVMDAVKKENMGDATAEILLTRLKGFDK